MGCNLRPKFVFKEKIIHGVIELSGACENGPGIIHGQNLVTQSQEILACA